MLRIQDFSMLVLCRQERQAGTCRLRAFAFLICIKMFLWSRKNTLKLNVLFFSHMDVFDPSSVTLVISDSSFSSLSCHLCQPVHSFIFYTGFFILFNFIFFSCSFTVPSCLHFIVHKYTE